MTWEAVYNFERGRIVAFEKSTASADRFGRFKAQGDNIVYQRDSKTRLSIASDAKIGPRSTFA